MKLSEAIRLGEFALPEARRRWFSRDANSRVCGACAVGRACFAAGYDPALFQCSLWDASMEGKDLSAFMTQHWPWTATVPLELPVNSGIRKGYVPHPAYAEWNPVLRMMSELYEHYQWTMQQLAEWVEGLEAQYATIEQEAPSALQTVEA